MCLPEYSNVRRRLLTSNPLFHTPSATEVFQQKRDENFSLIRTHGYPPVCEQLPMGRCEVSNVVFSDARQLSLVPLGGTAGEVPGDFGRQAGRSEVPDAFTVQGKKLVLLGHVENLEPQVNCITALKEEIRGQLFSRASMLVMTVTCSFSSRPGGNG